MKFFISQVNILTAFGDDIINGSYIYALAAGSPCLAYQDLHIRLFYVHNK